MNEEVLRQAFARKLDVSQIDDGVARKKMGKFIRRNSPFCSAG